MIKGIINSEGVVDTWKNQDNAVKDAQRDVREKRVEKEQRI